MQLRHGAVRHVGIFFEHGAHHGVPVEGMDDGRAHPAVRQDWVGLVEVLRVALVEEEVADQVAGHGCHPEGRLRFDPRNIGRGRRQQDIGLAAQEEREPGIGVTGQQEHYPLDAGPPEKEIFVGGEGEQLSRHQLAEPVGAVSDRRLHVR